MSRSTATLPRKPKSPSREDILAALARAAGTSCTISPADATADGYTSLREFADAMRISPGGAKDALFRGFSAGKLERVYVRETSGHPSYWYRVKQ